MSFEMECFSMNSDISKQINAFSLPKRNSAKALCHFSFADTRRTREIGTNRRAVLAISARRASVLSP